MHQEAFEGCESVQQDKEESKNVCVNLTKPVKNVSESYNPKSKKKEAVFQHKEKELWPTGIKVLS